MSGTNLFFWALIPEGESREVFQTLKESWAATYRSYRSLNSPPHVTLIPPVRMLEHGYQTFQDQLAKEVSATPPVNLSFRRFGKFGTKVIYLEPEPSERLQNLFSLCSALYQASGRQLEYAVYHPHMTLVFKDLKKTQFERAWDRWGEEKAAYQATIHHLSALQYVDKKWSILNQIPLLGN